MVKRARDKVPEARRNEDTERERERERARERERETMTIGFNRCFAVLLISTLKNNSKLLAG